ncbi:MAG: thioredoxin [Candidatus Methanomethyliaceae archaeon]|nr:thioredoxin [Candidatus Methanomethyliaceae archaeon]MDW7971239.1 thioredoxin [Nitrososphaerota archaeon]
MNEEFDEEVERIKLKKLKEIIKAGGGKMERSYLELNDENFDAVVNSSNLLVVVDFWAPWCGPCIVMAPIFERLARKYKDKVLMAKMNVDENLEVPQRFNIYGIPTFIFIKNGKEVKRIIGAVRESELEAEILRWIK